MCKKQIEHMNKKYSVFVSSTYEDLKEERKKVQEILLMSVWNILMRLISLNGK